MDNKSIEKISKKIAEGGKNVFFTGAGISTESGIPDFRSQGGIWDQYRPVYYDEFMSSEESRIEYWRQKAELFPDLEKAKPNEGHIAIARLNELGFLDAVITQNIDGLHQLSGLPDEKIIELHGNTTRVRCMSCSETSSMKASYDRIQKGELAPICHCGGYLKPDTISFGQAMPAAEMERAAQLSMNCDFFCVVGSTLLVHPAAHMPVYAKENSAFLCIVNLSETPCDKMCDALVSDNAGDVLSAIVDEVERLIK
ncbi:MAG: sigma factor regulator FecR [Desulfobacterales bacterium]|nr:sigma factor regulator FecR [Desulfobacterales bacterium]